MKFLLLLFLAPLFGDELTIDPPTLREAETCPTCAPLFPLLEEQGIVIDLKDPCYEDGVLITDQGGILTARDLRIQARCIRYIHRSEQEAPECTVFCEGDLLIDYGPYALVGESFTYNFVTHTGTLFWGKTARPPWYISGERVDFCANGDLRVFNATITTCEDGSEDLAFSAKEISLSKDRALSASSISFHADQLPLFWLPFLHLNLARGYSSPFAFQFGWGGFLGTHLGARYQFLDWKEWEAYARLDGYIGRGLGGGIESAYAPKGRCTQLYTRSYFAHDISIDDPSKRDRYRFQGTFYDNYFEECTSVGATYDVVSDAEMAADYQSDDFALNAADRTAFFVRHEDPYWIVRLFSRIRANAFQSVNQELPTLMFRFHPIDIGCGLLADNYVKASYLDYVFSDDIVLARDFRAGRLEVRPHLLWPFSLGAFTVTPEAGWIGICYSDSPEGGPVGQSIVSVGANLESTLSRLYGSCIHTLVPYLAYQYLTVPESPLDQHYLFTIEDGYVQYNILRFGMRSLLLPLGESCCFPLRCDLWANAFFDTPTLPFMVPRAYLTAEWQPCARMKSTFEGIWDIQQRTLDALNVRALWTVSEDFAFSFEVRHRSRFEWRKADHSSFLLDSARSIPELLASPLSDRRSTYLFTSFFRLNPDWEGQVSLKYGWNRPLQPDYIEYQAEVSRYLTAHLRLKFLYEKRTEDHRFLCSVKFDPGPPRCLR